MISMLRPPGLSGPFPGTLGRPFISERHALLSDR